MSISMFIAHTHLNFDFYQFIHLSVSITTHKIVLLRVNVFRKAMHDGKNGWFKNELDIIFREMFIESCGTIK